jgi:hypothetical protein
MPKYRDATVSFLFPQNQQKMMNMKLICLLFLSLLLSFAYSTKITIDMNDKSVNGNGKTRNSRRTPSIENSFTNTKITGQGNQATSSISMHNLKEVEKKRTRKDYFRKADIVASRQSASTGLDKKDTSSSR